MFDSIFESNLVNLLLLDGGLLYFLKGSLTENLSNRHKETVESLQDAEGKLLEAKTKQKDSLRVLAETQLIVKSIEADSKTTAQQVETNISSNGKEEINRFKTRSKAQVPAMEAKMAIAVAQEYIDEAVSIALGSLQNFFQGGDSWKNDLMSDPNSELDRDFLEASGLLARSETLLTQTGDQRFAVAESKIVDQTEDPLAKKLKGVVQLQDALTELPVEESELVDQTEDQMLAAGESNERAIFASSIGEKKERSPESHQIAKKRQLTFLSKVLREFFGEYIVLD